MFAGHIVIVFLWPSVCYACGGRVDVEGFEDPLGNLNGKTVMSESTASGGDFGFSSDKISDLLNEMRSIDEFASWLRSQPGVTSVLIADYLIKTEPPQQEVVVRFLAADGTVVTKVIDVVLNPNGTLEFGGLHNP